MHQPVVPTALKFSALCYSDFVVLLMQVIYIHLPIYPRRAISSLKGFSFP